MTDQTAWTMYFTTIAGMLMHPGVRETNTLEKLSNAAALADVMLAHHKIRWDNTCHLSGEQQSQESPA